jgi:signal transduction histidine kinase/CheY-like chemotaxis protein
VEERILILAPRGRDSIIAADLLNRHHLASDICASLPALVGALHEGAGTVLITEEALAAEDRAALSAWIRAQPRWSDLPFIVLANGGTAPRSALASERLQDLGNVVLLQRPLHAEAMLDAIRSALKARRRQYEIRASSETLTRAVLERTRDLEVARDNLEFALDAAGMGSWDLNLATGKIDRTERHDQIFGYAEPLPCWTVELLLQHVQPQERPAVAAAFADASMSGGLDIEIQIVGADGIARWIVKKGRVRYDTDGRPVRIIGVVSDVTDRKEADAQLAQAQKMDAIGQLTGGIAHDVNNLLTPIVGSLDVIRRRHKEDARTQRMISSALQAAERAAILTHRLLSFARRQTLQPQAVDVGVLINGIVELIRRSLGPTIIVTVDVPPQLPSAHVDPNQLELALLNLAINARDAMPSGGTLALSVTEAKIASGNPLGLTEGHYVRIVASDTGIGMDKATLARATEPFFSTKGIGKGTGLGLSMAHGLAAQSGGILQLSSVPDVGTTVDIFLPVTDDIPHTESGSDAEVSPAPRAAKILLIDDEEIVRSITADMLRDIGYVVVEAGSASAALSVLISDQEVEALVTDYLMPIKTGAALIRELRTKGNRLPALLITGYAAAGDDVPPDVLRLGKPFKQRDLAAKLDELIRKSGSKTALRAVEPGGIGSKLHSEAARHTPDR